MKRIAQFEKVSRDAFVGAGYTEEEYEAFPLPVRATAGSAGYDFFCVRDLSLLPNETATVATGVRAKIDEGWVLKLYPRSGLGFKYRLTLNNTVGIIDSDYYYSDNEGHIFVRMTNLGDKPLFVPAGQAFCQGVFVEYGITYDDAATTKRNGGLGSTTK